MPKTPIADRIVADYVELIESGRLVFGERLPSLRALAEQYGASETPVKMAVRELQLRGYIEGHQGRGNYVIWQPLPG